MKIGDLVTTFKKVSWGTKAYRGLIVGFNGRAGGKEIVYVLVDGAVCTFMDFDIELIDESR